MRLLKNIFNLFVIFTIFGIAYCDFYTSISGLEELLAVEDHYMKAMEKHLVAMETVHNQFKSLLNEIESEHAQDNHNSTQHLEYPVNAFKMIRRVVVDMSQLNKLTTDIANLRVFNESASTLKLSTMPTDNDLRGASMGFARLQKMYKLDTGDMARGVLIGQKYSSAMSAYNCYILGKNLYEAGEFKLASEWLLEALVKLEELENLPRDDVENLPDKFDFEENEMEDGYVEDLPEEYDDDMFDDFQINTTLGDDDYEDIIENAEEYEDEDLWNNKLDNDNGIYPYVTKEQILEYLPASLYSAGNPKAAAVFNDKLLQLDPKNFYGLGNKDLYANGVRNERRKRVLDKPATPISKYQLLYHQVCSGEVQQTPREQRHLRCRYVTNNVPFYFLGPLKMEELNTDPFVAFYHQVIYDNEIDRIISSVEDSIERSKVGGNTHSRYDEIRISKNSWLDFKEHRFLDAITQRLEDITGLTMETGEQLQVANYGIGGHYGPHHDFHASTVEDWKTGNRILTALFYINDVELGGSTAFPALRLAVPPIKGSMVVWHNFHKSLDRDYRTWHAGCPVLHGSKWICNEWFSTKGQEFHRPCGLQRDNEGSLPYKNWY
ncbi:prolyl 4-hydroxylase subunit alpha-2-like [Musca domestica]|uniref:procollagen-proline 4-dioxygenase n=1 Tax=Musca domestica TaxID=7370 RepID=A0A1I8NIA0_MUSDO|nr:prolyl 4-hydroxylase subunit alpha-2-like [Musca domestica]